LKEKILLQVLYDYRLMCSYSLLRVYYVTRRQREYYPTPFYMIRPCPQCKRVRKTLPLLVLTEKAQGSEELSFLFKTQYNVQNPKDE
jgi:glutaredoxin